MTVFCQPTSLLDSSPKNNANNIRVYLHTIYQEPFENGYTQPFLLKNYI